MRDEQHAARLQILETIAMTTRVASEALAVRDLESLRDIAAEREELFRALQTVDTDLKVHDRAHTESAEGRDLRRRADALLSVIVPAEEAMRHALEAWLAESRDAVSAARKNRKVRSRYAVTAVQTG